MAQFVLQSNPQSLGKLAPTAASPIRATSNLSNAYGNTSSSLDLWARSMFFAAPASNAGNVFILISGGVTSTLAGVVAVLEPGQSWPLISASGGNEYWVGTYFVDVATTGDYCSGSAEVY